MTFDPKKHLIRVNGNREYLPVAARLIWFRQDHPDWGIVTSPVEINLEKQYSIFSCTIMNAEGKVMATATKMENVRGFPDYLEKSETGSVGRALAMCGYGTQFAPEFDEESRYADAPMAPYSPPLRQQVDNGPSRPPVNAPRPNGNAPRPANGNGSNASSTAAPANNSGGITRVREPERALVDPGGPDEEDDGEDPFGDEPLDGATDAVAAAPVTSAAPPAPIAAPAPKPNALAGNRCSVEGCPNVLTAGQMTMTMNKFGRPLCLLHQKDAQPVAAAGASSNGRRAASGGDSEEAHR